MAGVTCAAMTTGSVISALASRPGMSSQPLGGGSRPTCEVLIRVMLRCMLLSFRCLHAILRVIIQWTSDRTGCNSDPMGSCRLRSSRPGCGIRVASTARAVAWKVVSNGSPLVEADLSRRRRAGIASLTPSGPRAVMLNNRGEWPPPGHVANRKWDFRGHGRSLKPTSFTSVSDRSPHSVVTKQVRSERCAPRTGGDRGRIARERPSATAR